MLGVFSSIRSPSAHGHIVCPSAGTATEPLTAAAKSLPKEPSEGRVEETTTPIHPPAAASKTATTLLTELMGPSRGGRNETSTDPNHVKRRSRRAAPQVAELFQQVLAELNVRRGFEVAPLTFRDVLPHMEAGRKLLQELEVSKEQRVLASGAIKVIGMAGTANTATLVGLYGAENESGKLSNGKLSAISNFSSSHIMNSRRKVEAGDLGTFGNLARTTSMAVLQGGSKLRELKKADAPPSFIKQAEMDLRSAKQAVCLLCIVPLINVFQ